MSRYYRNISAVLVVLLQTACGMHYSSPYNIRNRADEMVLGSPNYLNDTYEIPNIGMSIHFESLKGWTYLDRKNNEVKFYKWLNHSQIHSAAITAHQIYPPRTHFVSFDDYFNYMKQDSEQLQKAQEYIEFEFVPDSDKAPYCGLLHMKGNNRDEKNRPGIPLILDIYEYICQHPYRNDVFVNFHYSERFPAAADIKGVRSRAKDAFRYIVFDGSLEKPKNEIEGQPTKGAQPTPSKPLNSPNREQLENPNQNWKRIDDGTTG